MYDRIVENDDSIEREDIFDYIPINIEPLSDSEDQDSTQNEEQWATPLELLD